MKLKHFSICALSLMAGLALTVACSGDDDKDSNQSSTFDGRLSGTIKTESGAALNGEIDALEVSYDPYSSSDYSPHTYTVTTNGAFDFTLPTPTAADLYPLVEDVPGGMSITPADVRCVSPNIHAYKNGVKVGYISKSKTTVTSRVELTYIYANKAAVVTGAFTEEDENYTLNMNLVAGWNIVVAKMEISGNKYYMTLTTGNVPTDLQWTFYEIRYSDYADDGYESPIAKTGFGLFGK
jgi:hypothetical protein